MHEMAIVTDILDAVCKHAQDAGASRITGITLVAGEVRDIHEDLLQGYVDWFGKGTIAEGATIKLLVQPLRFRCRECGEIYRYDLKRGAICDELGAVLAGPGAGDDMTLGEEHHKDCQHEATVKARPHCLKHPEAIVDVTTGYELQVLDIDVE